MTAFALGLSLIALVAVGAITVCLIFLVVATISAGPYVPTRQATVLQMLQVAGVKPGEKLIDLGSGDGRILLAAARFGALATGYEINPFLVFLSRWRLRKVGLQNKAKVIRGNLWWADLRETDIVTLYLIDYRMGALEKKLQRELKSGSRVVSSTFRFPTWKPERAEGNIYLYRR